MDILVTIVLASGILHAGSFDEREKAGKAALATPEGRRYEASWGEVMQTVVPVCVPPGSTSPANLGKFTFVANVASSGLVSDVDVQPSTDVSRCFAKHFSGALLPPPPPAASRRGGPFPIADSLVIAP